MFAVLALQVPVPVCRFVWLRVLGSPIVREGVLSQRPFSF